MTSYAKFNMPRVKFEEVTKTINELIVDIDARQNIDENKVFLMNLTKQVFDYIYNDDHLLLEKLLIECNDLYILLTGTLYNG